MSCQWNVHEALLLYRMISTLSKIHTIYNEHYYYTLSGTSEGNIFDILRNFCDSKLHTVINIMMNY